MPIWIPWSTILFTAETVLRSRGWPDRVTPSEILSAERECPGVGRLLLPPEKGATGRIGQGATAPEPEFRIAPLGGAVLLRALAALRRNGYADPETFELIVRHAVRGWRHLRDAEGHTLDCQLESSRTGVVLLAETSFETLTLSALVPALAIAICSRRPLEAGRGNPRR